MPTTRNHKHWGTTSALIAAVAFLVLDVFLSPQSVGRLYALIPPSLLEMLEVPSLAEHALPLFAGAPEGTWFLVSFLALMVVGGRSAAAIADQFDPQHTAFTQGLLTVCGAVLVLGLVPPLNQATPLGFGLRSVLVGGVVGWWAHVLNDHWS